MKKFLQSINLSMVFINQNGEKKRWSLAKKRELIFIRYSKEYSHIGGMKWMGKE